MTIPRRLLLALMTLSAACQTTQPASNGDPKSLLTGPEWRVESIDGQEVIEDSRITLHFTDDGKVHGRTGCNLYNGSYQISGESLNIGELSQTRMACAPSVMQQEQALLKVLQNARRLRIDESGALFLEGASRRGLKAYRS